MLSRPLVVKEEQMVKKLGAAAVFLLMLYHPALGFAGTAIVLFIGFVADDLAGRK